MSGRQSRLSWVLILMAVFVFTACTQPQATPVRETKLPTSEFSYRLTEEALPQNRTEDDKQVKTPVEPSEIPPKPTTTPTKIVDTTPILTHTAIPSVEDSAIIPAHDMLLVSSGDLRLWSSQTGEVSRVFQEPESLGTPVSTLSGTQKSRVADIKLDGKYQRIVILRSRGISANGVEIFDLELMDLTSGTAQVLLEETPAVYNLGISPDGEWVTYTFQPQGGGPIFSINTQDASEPIIIDVCEAETESNCEGITWLEDQNSIMWIDRDGVWLSAPPNFEPVRIVENRVPIIDLEGNERTIEVNYSHLRWSPKGRYLLTDIHPLRSEIHWEGVIDTLRGGVIEVPGSYEYDQPSAAAEWLPDGDLLVLQTQMYGPVQKLQVTIYNVVPTSETLLVQEQAYALDFSEVLSEEVGNKEDVEFVPQYIFPESDRTVWTILVFPQDGIHSRLFQLDLKYRLVTKVYETPIGEIGYHWSPYSPEAILAVQPEGLYYFSETLPRVYDINPVLGVDSCCFQWMP